MRRPFRDDDSFEAVLGGFSYLVLAILDLVTTTILLRAFPGQAHEANVLLASVLDVHGIEGLWIVKLLGALAATALYLHLRWTSGTPRGRGLADIALVISCALQGAIVLSNLGAWFTLTA